MHVDFVNCGLEECRHREMVENEQIALFLDCERRERISNVGKMLLQTYVATIEIERIFEMLTMTFGEHCFADFWSSIEIKNLTFCGWNH